MTDALRGVAVLYNTYWVRFNHRRFTHAQAVANTRVLFSAAKRAGVERIVHVSITNPSESSPLDYFRGKAQLERSLIESGISHAILRPAVFFGHEDILVNNIAWALRTLPAFVVFGSGHYQLQPIHIDDFSELAVQYGQSGESVIIDTVGPETFTYRGLVEDLGHIIGVERPLIPVPAWLGYYGAKVVGMLKGDVLLTRDEIDGLMNGLLATSSLPMGRIKLTDWARAHASTLGIHYASELARRMDRTTPY